MTAAHCLRNHNSNFQILLGQSNLNSETFGQYRQLVSVSRVEQHPKYDNKSGKLLKDLVIYENVILTDSCSFRYIGQFENFCAILV